MGSGEGVERAAETRENKTERRRREEVEVEREDEWGNARREEEREAAKRVRQADGRPSPRYGPMDPLLPERGRC